jgi:hypothetical protein
VDRGLSFERSLCCATTEIELSPSADGPWRTCLGWDEPNGYLINQSGDVEQVFTFGDGVADVLISSEHE